MVNAARSPLALSHLDCGCQNRFRWISWRTAHRLLFTLNREAPAAHQRLVFDGLAEFLQHFRIGFFLVVSREKVSVTSPMVMVIWGGRRFPWRPGRCRSCGQGSGSARYPWRGESLSSRLKLAALGEIRDAVDANHALIGKPSWRRAKTDWDLHRCAGLSSVSVKRVTALFTSESAVLRSFWVLLLLLEAGFWCVDSSWTSCCTKRFVGIVLCVLTMKYCSCTDLNGVVLLNHGGDFPGRFRCVDPPRSRLLSYRYRMGIWGSLVPRRRAGVPAARVFPGTRPCGKAPWQY